MTTNFSRLLLFLGCIATLSAACAQDAPLEQTPDLVIFTQDGTQLPVLGSLETIRITVSDPTTDAILKEDSFAYSSGGGNIESIPFGESLQVAIDGLDATGNTILQGKSLPFSLTDEINTLNDIDSNGTPEIPVFVSEVDSFTPAVALRAGDIDPLQSTPSYFQVPLKRAGHAQTVLPNGFILITGGVTLEPSGALVPTALDTLNAGQALNTVEIYDPRTGLFLERPPMSQPRAFHTMTALKDGRVLIVGGLTVDNSGASPVLRTLASAEIFNPFNASQPWEQVSGDLFDARAFHTATTRATDGKILFIGGRTIAEDRNDVLASVEIFDPAVNAFINETLSLGEPRTDHTAVLLQGGRGKGSTVLVVGGRNDAGALGSTEAVLFDPASGTSARSGPTLNVPRFGHNTLSVSPENGNLVLVTGGLNASGAPAPEIELLDLETGEFFNVGVLFEPRAYASMVELPESQHTLVFGGLGAQGALVTSAERLVYNEITGRYVPTLLPSRMGLGRYYAQANRMDNGVILITGGATQGALGMEGTDSAEFLNPLDEAAASAQ